MHAPDQVASVSATGAVVMQMERDTAYGLTLVWALVAVYGAQGSRGVRFASIPLRKIRCFSMTHHHTAAIEDDRRGTESPWLCTDLG